MHCTLNQLLSRRSLFSLCAATLSLLPLTGCGLGASQASTSTGVMPAIHGVTMGGETPIAGATVLLWETDPANTGYGLTARQIEAATVTGANFSFATGYTCTNANDFLYITSTGGDVTDGSTSPLYNPNLVLMAVLGSCAALGQAGDASAQAAIQLDINELSTVAAAYALGAFLTVNANGGNGQQLVYIGAPATNAGTSGSCTGTGSAMSCTAAGLAHAFANAANLVNSSSSTGFPSGLAYTTVPGNSLGSVPQALLHTLGNIVQYCTNSGNTSASSTTVSAACGTFFGDATPVGGTAPADTLSALVNIAHFPTHSVGTTCTGITGGLYCLAGSYPAFSPALSAAPRDWSLGIAYSGTPQGTFGIPQYLTLDANDNVYVQTGNQHGPTQTGLAAMTASGGAIWYKPQSTSYCTQGVLATDTNQNVFLSIPVSTTNTGCAFSIYGFSTVSGAATYTFGPASGTVCGTTSPTSSNCPGFTAFDATHGISSEPNGIAVDRLSNVWYNRLDSSCATCQQKLPYTAGTGYGAATNSQGASGADWDAGQGLVVDPTGNVYSSSLSTNIYATPNKSPSTPDTPSYTSTSGYVSQAVGGTASGLMALDSAGNVWSSYSGEFVEFTPTKNGSNVITGFSAATGSPFAGSGLTAHVGEFDGHDNLFAPSYTTSGLIFFQTSPSATGYSTSKTTYFAIAPCYAASGATTCSSTVASSDPHVVQIDSTGAIWVAGTGSSGGNPGFVVQVIGTAYPTWPQLSYGEFGVTP